jgi:hypothetical protein
VSRSHASNRARIGATVAVAVIAVGALAGCGGNGKQDGYVPLETRLGLDGPGMLQRQRQAENLIAPCMRRSGFEYVPADPVAQQRALLGGTGSLDDDEFQKQYGYGITTLFAKRQAQDADPGANPNATYRAALDPAGQAAFDRALYGDDPTATLVDALDNGDFTRLGGCVKQAAAKEFGGVEVIQSLQTKLDDLDERILEDARMTKAVGKWSDCMRGNGYDFGAQDDVDAYLQNKLDAIVGSPEEPNPDYDHAALSKLGSEEIRLVGYDVGCEEKDITKVEDKVRPEYERTFSEQNAALIAKVPKP